jgi:hypothetical protein
MKMRESGLMPLCYYEITEWYPTLFADTLKPKRDFLVRFAHPMRELLAGGQQVEIFALCRQTETAQACDSKMFLWGHCERDEPCSSMCRLQLAHCAHPPEIGTRF